MLKKLRILLRKKKKGYKEHKGYTESDRMPEGKPVRPKFLKN